MFCYASSFNQNLSSWDVSKVNDFSEIFSFTEMPGEIQDRIEDNPKPEWIFSYFSKLLNKE
jgi:surface protein